MQLAANGRAWRIEACNSSVIGHGHAGIYWDGAGSELQLAAPESAYLSVILLLRDFAGTIALNTFNPLVGSSTLPPPTRNAKASVSAGLFLFGM